MSKQLLRSKIYPISIPLAPSHENGWKGYWQFTGNTPNKFWLSCHVSVLTNGSCPHPPHEHDEEEILLLLEGKVDLILPKLSKDYNKQRFTIWPGQFIYYPANFPHTLECTSDKPANYLMLKWVSKKRLEVKNDGQACKIYSAIPAKLQNSNPNGFHSKILFENSTAYLQKVHSHLTILETGGGYAEHADNHEVIIVMLEGECQTLGKKIKNFDVVYYAAGEPHGIKNIGSQNAVYLVFEFHGSYRKSLFSTVLSRVKTFKR